MSEHGTSTVLVTGGARGIGAAVVRAVHRAGASAIIADILDDTGERLAKELGDRAHYVHLDVTSPEDWTDAVAAAERAAGPLTSVVNNAGILDIAPIETQPVEDFRRVLDVNLFGTWLGMRAALPSLRRSGGGSIVNISSTAGMQGYAGIGAYVASKWAVRGLTKTAALEFAADGVRVCSVHPGPIRTPMTAEMDDSVVAGQPIQRFGDPEEVARMVHFLLTEATYSTGSEFMVDGGAIAGTTLPLDTT
ncbi:3alpha(or 20beta)-hydroxysteroid dehydrogenase [Nocardiopsis mwathae]|uniref:3alpha(Or 20beta)-hydroxysteroid dehydrogenase n=1 Tax=Nocardiopsis mwathae TaxID=1472723 RepID=A0A7X0D4Y6_9ACTN|nr:SDR family oxidoreductase [Nocardiopsis mwathae]MBB6171693.1 3alpha(or 20beta)-hydroxysteroid dehydrogenase [Nocardiopsis mwathae]